MIWLIIKFVFILTYILGFALKAAWKETVKELTRAYDQPLVKRGSVESSIADSKNANSKNADSKSVDSKIASFATGKSPPSSIMVSASCVDIEYPDLSHAKGSIATIRVCEVNSDTDGVAHCDPHLGTSQITVPQSTESPVFEEPESITSLCSADTKPTTSEIKHDGSFHCPSTKSVPQTPERKVFKRPVSAGAESTSGDSAFSSASYFSGAHDTPRTSDSLLAPRERPRRHSDLESPSLRKSPPNLPVPDALSLESLPDDIFDPQGRASSRTRNRSKQRLPAYSRLRSRSSIGASDRTVECTLQLAGPTRKDTTTVKQGSSDSGTTAVKRLRSDRLDGLEKRVDREKRTVFASRQHATINALQICDTVYKISERWRARPKTCYADTRHDERCSKALKGDEESIKDILDELDSDKDAKTVYDESLEIVRRLLNVILCSSSHRKQVDEHLQHFREGCIKAQARLYAARISGNASHIAASTITVDTRKTYGHSGFEHWQPDKTFNASPDSCLRKLVNKPLLSSELVSGNLYVYRTELVFGFVKIGMTEGDHRKRLKQWRNQCGHEVVPLIKIMRSIPHVRRVEKLVHGELKDRRLRQTHCICTKEHIEWFDVSESDAMEVIEKWSTWIEKSPYHNKSGGALREDLVHDMDQLCTPSNLKLETPTLLRPEMKHASSAHEEFHHINKNNRTGTIPMAHWNSLDKYMAAKTPHQAK